MGSVLAGAGALFGGLFIVVAVLVANGGYVYKTTCPTSAGSTQTSWTYDINDIVPYLNSASAPCVSHSGTRLLISAVGIAPLGHHEAQYSSAEIAENKSLAGALATTTTDIDQEYAYERTQTTKTKALAAKNRSAALAYAVLMIRGGITRLNSFKGQLDSAPDAPDGNLTDAKTLLSQWLGLQSKADRVSLAEFQTGAVNAQAKAQAVAVGRELQPIVLKLRGLAPTLSADYPQLTHWSYLGSQ